MKPSAEPLRVLLTREAEDCSLWGEQLVALGLRPVSFPCIEVRPVAVSEDELHAGLSEHAWLALSSVKAVELLAERLEGASDALPAIACVGPRTAQACRELLEEPTLVAPKGTARSLGEALAPRLQPGAKVLFLCAREGLNHLAEELGDDTVTRLALYATEPRTDRSEPPAHDAIFFASPSAVEGFARRAGAPSPGTLLVALGPSTADRIAERGWSPVVVSEERSLRGMAAALSDHWSASGAPRHNH